jgi:hypothetical protein
MGDFRVLGFPETEPGGRADGVPPGTREEMAPEWRTRSPGCASSRRRQGVRIG